MKTQSISKQTQKNWWVDAALLGSALAAGLSGIYFLYLPSGGFMGGRNPTYGIQIIFERLTWEDIHTWGGIIMISAALIHLVIHWSWVVNMSKRIWKEITGQCSTMNAAGKRNLLINALVALSFLITALSGIYFLFAPGGHGAADPGFIFSSTTWDLIHTWAGNTMIAAAVIHFAIHWKWVTKVTKSMVGKLRMPDTEKTPIPVSNS